MGLSPSSLPMGLDLDRWLARAPTTWDTFPDARDGKMDAETCALLPALEHPNVTIVSGAEVSRLIPASGGRNIESVEDKKDGEARRIRCGRSFWRRGQCVPRRSCWRRAQAACLAFSRHSEGNRLSNSRYPVDGPPDTVAPVRDYPAWQ
ncbi:hypothetical protein AGR8A_pTi20145 [Agrobacterium fabrum str. J-07]|nr:hypothetical protein AGR8A_pTi20145 [Agrobacterium fabrum str. J-07]